MWPVRPVCTRCKSAHLCGVKETFIYTTKAPQASMTRVLPLVWARLPRRTQSVPAPPGPGHSNWISSASNPTPTYGSGVGWFCHFPGSCGLSACSLHAGLLVLYASRMCACLKLSYLTDCLNKAWNQSFFECVCVRTHLPHTPGHGFLWGSL